MEWSVIHLIQHLEPAEEAADLRERLLDLAESAAVPESYREPMHQWHDLAEASDEIPGPHDSVESMFEDAEEREATRRMTWVLIHNADAQAMLSEITRRRDAFVAEEGSMPANLPPY